MIERYCVKPWKGPQVPACPGTVPPFLLQQGLFPFDSAKDSPLVERTSLALKESTMRTDLRI